MELNGLKTLIVGGGIGGLTAALALRQKGADVTVLEQAEAITEVGAGLQVSPNGVCVLRALGLEDGLKQVGVKARGVSLRNYRDSREVLHLDLGLLKEQSYYFLHRADLIGLLADAAREAGVKIRLLQKVESIEASETPVVHLNNGADLKADLVIGADGLHSKVRTELNGVLAPFFTRQVAWRAVVPNSIGHPPQARVHMGPGRHIVSYPLRGGEVLNLVAVQERGAWAEEGWNHKDDPANLREAFADFGHEAQGMLALVHEVGLWGLFRHPVAKTWHRGHVAILGDAAHPTLPFMAQGAVMAMEDAWVLADALDRGNGIADGLASYQARRIERATKVIDTASNNAWKYHLSFGPARFVAHNLLRLGGAVAPGRMLHQFDWIYAHDVTAEPN